MLKLLRFNIKRILKSKTFWICSAIYIFYGLLLTFFNLADGFPVSGDRLVNFGLSGWPFTGLFILIKLSVIVGVDLNGTIRNKILIGHSKSNIYLAYVLAFSLCEIAVSLIFTCITLPFSFPMIFYYTWQAIFKDVEFIILVKTALLTLLFNALTATMYVSLYTLIIANTKNIAATIVSGIVSNVVAILVSWGILMIIDAESGDGSTYLLHLFAYLYPTGIDIFTANFRLISYGSEIPIYTALITVLSAALIALTTFVGAKLFKKSNVK